MQGWPTIFSFIVFFLKLLNAHNIAFKEEKSFVNILKRVTQNADNAINVTYSRQCSCVSLFGMIRPRLSRELIENRLYTLGLQNEKELMLFYIIMRWTVSLLL